MKNRAIFFAALCAACLLASGARGRENPYDVWAKTLAPFADIFAADAKPGAVSLNIELSVGEVTQLPPEMKGARISIVAQPPDKLRVQVPALGSEAIVCRDGQR